MRNNLPTISVIIITSGYTKGFLKLLDSVVRQTYKFVEVIVVDQSNNDKIQRLIAKYKDFNIKHYRIKNNGVSRSRNFGITHSTGDIITFIVGDITLPSSWLFNIYKTFQKYGYAAAVIGQIKYNQFSGDSVENKLRIIQRLRLYDDRELYKNNTAFRRQLFNKIGYFSGMLGVGSIGKSSEDLEFAIRILYNNYTLVYNPKVVVYQKYKSQTRDLKISNIVQVCGDMACYLYYYLLGFNLGKNIVMSSVFDGLNTLKNDARLIFSEGNSKSKILTDYIVKMLNIFIGIFVAILLFLKRAPFVVYQYLSLSSVEKIIFRKDAKKGFFFIQIGANNGIQNDPIYEYVENRGWDGILVEPIKYLYLNLKKSYCNSYNNLYFENSAIYKKRTKKAMFRLMVDSDKNNPEWYQGLPTFNKKVITCQEHKNVIPNFDKRLIKEYVDCITFKDLLNKYNVKKIDFLVIDTEGYDFEIIKQINFNNIKPNMILYEYKHLSTKDQLKCRDLLLSNGYTLIDQMYDTFAYLK